MDDERIRVEAHVVGEGRAPASDYLRIEDEELEREDFSGRKLKGLTAVGSRFRSCRFERMRIADACFGAGLRMSNYLECSFDGSWIGAEAPGRARFERCSFRDVTLKSWFCWNVEFIDCVFTGHAEQVVFNAAPLEEDRGSLGRSQNEFRGNDFSDMELRDVAFRGGIDLAQQVLPDGEGYIYAEDGQAAIARARAAVIGWGDEARRESALRILRLLGHELEYGQEQLFVRKDDYARRKGPDVLPDLFALIAGEPD